jgi:MYCBP-associated protein family
MAAPGATVSDAIAPSSSSSSPSPSSASLSLRDGEMDPSNPAAQVPAISAAGGRKKVRVVVVRLPESERDVAPAAVMGEDSTATDEQRAAEPLAAKAPASPRAKVAVVREVHRVRPRAVAPDDAEPVDSATVAALPHFKILGDPAAFQAGQTNEDSISQTTTLSSVRTLPPDVPALTISGTDPDESSYRLRIAELHSARERQWEQLSARSRNRSPRNESLLDRSSSHRKKMDARVRLTEEMAMHDKHEHFQQPLGNHGSGLFVVQADRNRPNSASKKPEKWYSQARSELQEDQQPEVEEQPAPLASPPSADMTGDPQEPEDPEERDSTESFGALPEAGSVVPALDLSNNSLEFDPVVCSASAAPGFASVRLANSGRVALNFQWVPVPQGNLLDEEPIARQEHAFSIHEEAGLLLPGESRACWFGFSPKRPGMCHAFFALVTDRPLAGAVELLKLSGMALIDGDTVLREREQRQKLRDDIKLNQERHAASDAIRAAIEHANAEIARQLEEIKAAKTQQERNKLEESMFYSANRDFALRLLSDEPESVTEALGQALGDQTQSVAEAVDRVHMFEGVNKVSEPEEIEPPDAHKRGSGREGKKVRPGSRPGSSTAPSKPVRSTTANSQSPRSMDDDKLKEDPSARRKVFYRTKTVLHLRRLAATVGVCLTPDDWNLSLVSLREAVEEFRDSKPEVATEFDVLLLECVRKPTEAELDDKGDGIVVPFTPATKALRHVLRNALDDVVGSSGSPHGLLATAEEESRRWLHHEEQALANLEEFHMLGSEQKSTSSSRSASQRSTALGMKRLTRKQREQQRAEAQAEYERRLEVLRHEARERFEQGVRASLVAVLDKFAADIAADEACIAGVAAVHSERAESDRSTTEPTPRKTGPARTARKRTKPKR